MSPDVRFAAVETPGGLRALALGDRSISHPLTRGSQDSFPRFSPDGKWLAYDSRQSDKFEVFVQDFPEGELEPRFRIREEFIPLWRRDQKEFFYLTPDGRMIAVDVRSRQIRIGVRRSACVVYLR